MAPLVSQVPSFVLQLWSWVSRAEITVDRIALDAPGLAQEEISFHNFYFYIEITMIDGVLCAHIRCFRQSCPNNVARFSEFKGLITRYKKLPYVVALNKEKFPSYEAVQPRFANREFL